MIALSSQMALLVMWVVFAALSLLGVMAVIVWAVRSRQFADQDRARRLPLDSGIPTDAQWAAPAGEDPKKQGLGTRDQGLGGPGGGGHEKG